MKAKILEEYSKSAMMKIVDWVGQDFERFQTLMELFLTEEYRVAQRISWGLIYITERYPDFILPYIPSLLEIIANPKSGETIKRNSIRVLTVVDIPEEYCGTAFEQCSKLFHSVREPIAIRVFSMTVMVNIALKYTDLISEVSILVTDAMAPNAQASLLARGKHELKRMSKRLKQIEQGVVPLRKANLGKAKRG